LSKKK